MEPLNRAFFLAGGAAELARAIGVPQSLPHMWLARRSVPIKHRPAIELASRGNVRVEELGDDVCWRRIRDRSWPHPAGRPLADFAPG